MVRTPPAPIYTERIPRELATNETWMLHGRKARPRVRPAAYFRPPGYEPEFRGSDFGIPLYRYDQVRHAVAERSVFMPENLFLGKWMPF